MTATGRRVPRTAAARPLAAALLACGALSACATPRTDPAGAPAAPPALGWLGELAGACWRARTVGAEVCYESDGERGLRWFSRNRGALLECGRFTPAVDGRIDAITWSADSVERFPGQLLGARSLSYLPADPREGGTMLRLDAGRFAIREADDRIALVFRRVAGRAADARMMAQCRTWER